MHTLCFPALIFIAKMHTKASRKVILPGKFDHGCIFHRIFTAFSTCFKPLQNTAFLRWFRRVGKSVKTHSKCQKKAPVRLGVGVLPRRNAFFYRNIDFLTVFTMFFGGRKTTVKHDTFDKCRAPVRHPRFFAISNGKKHSPPPVLRW